MQEYEQRIARFDLCKMGQGPLVMETTLIGFEFEWVFLLSFKKKSSSYMPYFIEPPANLFPEATDQLGHIRANVFVQTAFVILAPGWIVDDVAMTPVTSKNLNLELFASDSVSITKTVTSLKPASLKLKSCKVYTQQKTKSS